MPDNLDVRAAQDRSRININESHEVNYWTRHLGVNETELRLAVASVGVAVEEVRLHLGMAPSQVATA